MAMRDISVGTFKQLYDKLILIVLLIGLLVSALVLGVKIDQAQRQLVAAGDTAVPSREQAVETLDRAQLEARVAALQETLQVAPRTQRMFVSEVRVTCLSCGKAIPMYANKCPFCGFEEQGDEQVDSDGDGMPDAWEEQHGLNPFDPDDAHQDADGDGFTNLEEFRAGTDPRDPESFPPLAIKLRMVGAPIREPLRILFMATQEIIEGQKSFQLNMRDRTYFARVGDRVEGYEIVAYDEAQDALTVRVGERLRVLKRGRVETEEDFAIRLLLLVDRSEQLVKVGAEFSLRDGRYRLVGLTPEGLPRVVAVDTNREYVVPQFDPRELEPKRPETVPFNEGFPSEPPGPGRRGSPLPFR